MCVYVYVCKFCVIYTYVAVKKEKITVYARYAIISEYVFYLCVNVSVCVHICMCLCVCVCVYVCLFVIICVCVVCDVYLHSIKKEKLETMQLCLNVF